MAVAVARRFCGKKTFMAHQLAEGVAFQVARSDWESIIDCFVFGMAVGYRFVASKYGYARTRAQSAAPSASAPTFAAQGHERQHRGLRRRHVSHGLRCG